MTIVKFCIRHGDLKLEDVYINKKNLQKYCKECAKISKRKTNAKLKEKNKELIIGQMNFIQNFVMAFISMTL